MGRVSTRLAPKHGRVPEVLVAVLANTINPGRCLHKSSRVLRIDRAQSVHTRSLQRQGKTIEGLTILRNERGDFGTFEFDSRRLRFAASRGAFAPGDH